MLFHRALNRVYGEYYHLLVEAGYVVTQSPQKLGSVNLDRASLLIPAHVFDSIAELFRVGKHPLDLFFTHFKVRDDNLHVDLSSCAVEKRLLKLLFCGEEVEDLH